MKYMKDIKPYNKYWGNCIVNMFLSIIGDPSYEPLIYLNDYGYYFREEDVFLDYTKEYYQYFLENIFTVQKFNFKEPNNFFPELKRLIMSDQFVLVYIDLFYWIEDGLFYNKVHMPHSALITGFNEEESLFYVLEDDKNFDYEIKEVHQSRFIDAFSSTDKKSDEDYTLIRVNSSKMPSYQLNSSSVLSITKRLIDHLSDLMNRKDILTMEEMLTNIEFVYMFGIDCGKIANRFKGNAIFFNIMQEQNFIQAKHVNQLTNMAEDIGYKWSALKSIVMKSYYSGEFPELDSVNDFISVQLQSEREMWVEFLAKMR